MRKKTNFNRSVLIALWFSTLICAFSGLWWYKTRSGEINVSMSEWPSRSELKLNSTPLTLVMFVHPKCECSDASMHELSYIMKDAGSKLSAQIDFYFPENTNEDWTHSSLWEKAKALPATSIFPDKGGKNAYLFGARTSGETYLFNSAGKLLFHGGITQSRGHIGESKGRRTISSIVEGKLAIDTTTKPFGCALFSAKEYDLLSKALGPQEEY